MYKEMKRQTWRDLRDAIKAMLDAHGYVSDENCEQWECECLACIKARAAIAKAKGGE